MGAAACSNCSSLHPLTHSAAAALTGEPGLARRVSPRYRMSPRMTQPGQRFFYLELPGGPAAPGAPSPEARCSLLALRLDLPRSRVGVRLYLGETRAQEIAALLRTRTPGAAVAALTRTFRPALQAALRGDAYGRVRIVSGAVSPRLAHGPLLRAVSKSLRASIEARLLDHLATGLAAYFRAHARDFLDATADERSGVTLTLDVADPALLAPLRATLEAGAGGRSGGGSGMEPHGSVTVRAAAGYRRD